MFVLGFTRSRRATAEPEACGSSPSILSPLPDATPCMRAGEPLLASPSANDRCMPDSLLTVS